MWRKWDYGRKSASEFIKCLYNDKDITLYIIIGSVRGFGGTLDVWFRSVNSPNFAIFPIFSLSIFRNSRPLCFLFPDILFLKFKFIYTIYHLPNCLRYNFELKFCELMRKHHIHTTVGVASIQVICFQIKQKLTLFVCVSILLRLPLAKARQTYVVPYTFNRTPPWRTRFS